MTTKNRVLIATVTYGSRLSELQNGALNSYLKQNVNLLIIANGVTPEYRTSLETLSDGNSLKVLFLEENEGSAGGFHKLIKECKSLDYDYFILLDDDNELVGDINHYNHEHKASFIPREGRSYIEQALKGLDPNPYLARKNSFLGFDFKRIIAKKIMKPNDHFNVKTFNFPWAPYGGLILSKQVINSNIMPDKDFFLYCDDTLYTNQISNKFGLYLNDAFKIIDTQESWNVSSNGNVVSRILKSQEAWRTYYSVRNQIYFDNGRYDSFLIYVINMIGFFTVFTLLALFACITDKNKTSLVKVFIRAVRDGMSGRLGCKGFNI